MDADMTYEQAMKRLEAIVTKLESGKVKLDDAVTLYSEGAELSAFCTKYLDEIKQKITKIKA